MCLINTLSVTPVVYSFFDDGRGLRLGNFAPWRILRGIRTRTVATTSILLLVWFLLLASDCVAHTVSELTQSPTAFNQQPVMVAGEVANVVTRYGEPQPYTTFDLHGADESTLPVFIWGPPTFKQGDLYRVSGTFFVEKVLGAYALKHGVEATKVEKMPETEQKTVSALFRKKKKSGLKGARGVYIPQ